MIQMLLLVFSISFFNADAQNTRQECGEKMRAAAATMCTVQYQTYALAKNLGSKSKTKAWYKSYFRGLCNRYCTGTGISCSYNYDSCSALEAALAKISYDRGLGTDFTDEDVLYLYQTNPNKSTDDIGHVSKEDLEILAEQLQSNSDLANEFLKLLSL